MSEIRHPSLKAELLYLIGRATAPLSCAELYEKCELADEVAKVAKALANLQSDGKIARVAGEGRARYKLAAGVAAPAPAGKTGRSKAVQADDASRSAPLMPRRDGIQPDTGIRPMPESGESGPPALDIPTLADPGISLQGAAGKTRRAKPTPDHLADAGKVMLRGIDVDASAERMADAMLAKARAQLAAEIAPRWWIDQDGSVEIAVGDEMVRLTRPHAARMALVLLAAHDEMESL